MRLKNLSLEQLSEIGISSLSQRQLDELNTELLMRVLVVLAGRDKMSQTEVKPKVKHKVTE
jgi:methyltransferase-like protein